MSSFSIVPDMTTMHDPVHGSVTLDGLHGTADDTLTLLARSPELTRLRGIKQLGLAAFAFPAADHSRYAHALGTANVMRRLLEGRIGRQLREIDRGALAASFPALADRLGSAEEVERVIAAHLLVVALVQDVGEVPYAHATWRLFQAGPDVKAMVKKFTGSDAELGGAKEYFTAHFVCSSPLLADNDEIDIGFLLFLLFGSVALRSGESPPEDVAVLRHLVDGVVDADRLDYVYRDAHHTFGHIGGPQAVIDSLGYLDATGPVFREPGPVLDFVLTRFSIWSRVYFEAQNRFRITLLRVILRAVRGDTAAKEAFFNGSADGGLSTEAWMATDDAYVHAGLDRLEDSKDVKASWRQTPAGRTAQVALRAFLEAWATYEAQWLPPPDDISITAEKVELPEELFFDTCADFRHHRLYEHGSIRVDGPRFGRCDSPLPLEQCSKSLDGVFEATWFPLAIPRSVLLFLPESRPGKDWEDFESRVNSGTMYSHLLRMDEEQRLTTPDARPLAGYSGPDIFISYAFDDRDFVERVLLGLRYRERKYFLLESPLQQTGATPGENSVQAVEQADAVLVILSENYKQRAAADLDGNIAKEIMAMCRRNQAEGLPIAFISADDHEAIDGAFPWGEIGLGESPLVQALRDEDDGMVLEGIDRALQQIDADLE